jgi:Integrase core domain
VVIGKDLLAGGKDSYIATLVERHSRFLMLIKMPSKDTAVVVAALSRHARKLPATLRRSLTWHRGLEMAKHKDFTVATDVKAYFCDPQSPRQRGTNGNTNLLLRQYFPRGTRPVAHLSRAARSGLAALESTSEKNFRIPDACEYTASKCCVDRLSRQRKTGQTRTSSQMSNFLILQAT